jgi:hypothetical protein
VRELETAHWVIKFETRQLHNNERFLKIFTSCDGETRPIDLNEKRKLNRNEDDSRRLEPLLIALSFN